MKSDTSKRYIMVLPLLWNACWGIYFVLFLYPRLFLKWLPLLFLLSSSSPSSCSFFSDNRLSFAPSDFPEWAKSFSYVFFGLTILRGKAACLLSDDPTSIRSSVETPGIVNLILGGTLNRTGRYLQVMANGPFGSFLLPLVQNAPVLDHQLWISSSQTLCSTS